MSAGTGVATGVATIGESPPSSGPTTGSPGSAPAMAGPLPRGATTTGAAGATGTVTTTPAPGTGVAGSLTAGTWDDNLNFDFYTKYLATMNASQLAGLPLIDRTNRLEITAVDGTGAPLAGARITVSDASGKLFEATTRGDDKLFFFPGTVGAQTGDALTLAAALGQATGAAGAHVGDAKAEVAIAGAQATPVAALDLALVVDTTGSMGDELEYLKVEMSDIIARVAHDFPNVSQRWSAIFYRDTRDNDVDQRVRRARVRLHGDRPRHAQRSEISAQSCRGRRRHPRGALDQALATLTKVSVAWPDAVARMAFWVADAPHHVAQAQTMAQDILAAHGLGVRLYPSAASGTDDLL